MSSWAEGGRRQRASQIWNPAMSHVADVNELCHRSE